jgi:hypothetical protein
MFSKFMRVFGVVAITLGVITLMGSAGDCDGACGPGNDIPTMLMLIGYGLVLVVGGAASFRAGTYLGDR